ncbi:MAG: NUDIX hydrolase [bacterium]
MTNEYPDRPRLAVGGVVIRGDKVLLVRRGREPARGEWAIPGGSVEIGETLGEAVERELREETGIQAQAGDICHLFEAIRKDETGRVRFHYVIVDLLAEYVSGAPCAADDAREAAWLSADDLPGRPVNRSTLELLKKLGFLKS